MLFSLKSPQQQIRIANSPFSITHHPTTSSFQVTNVPDDSSLVALTILSIMPFTPSMRILHSTCLPKRLRTMKPLTHQRSRGLFKTRCIRGGFTHLPHHTLAIFPSHHRHNETHISPQPPRLKRERNDTRVLKVNLLRNKIQCSLTCTICRNRKRKFILICNTPRARRHCCELRIWGSF